MLETPRPKRYRRQTVASPGVVTMEVEATNFDTKEDAQVDFEVEILPYHQYFALDDRFVGALDPAKGDEPGKEGAAELKRRQEKMLAVTHAIGNLDPDDYEGGRITDPKGIEGFITDPNNANVVYLAAQLYHRRVTNPYPKSGTVDSGAGAGGGDDEGKGADEEAAGSHVPGVPGGGAAAA